MTGKTHQVIAVTTGLAVGVAVDATLVEHAALVGLAFLTARLPDIDQKLKWRGKRMFKHRTVTHYLFTVLAVSVLLATLASYLVSLFGPEMMAYVTGDQAAMVVFLGFMSGCGSHSLADACTHSGVPLLGPFIRRDFWILPRPFRMDWDGPMQSLLALLLMFADAAFVITNTGVLPA